MKNFKWDKKYLYWGATAFFVIIGCIAFFWVIQRWSGIKDIFSQLSRILRPIIWGIVLSYLLTPIVKFFERKLFSPLDKRLFNGVGEKRHKGFTRGMSIFLAVLLMLLLCTALVSMVLPQLYQSIEGIVLNLSSSIKKAEIWANKWLDDAPEINAIFTEIVGDIGTKLTQWAKDILLPQMNTIIASVSLGVFNALKAVANAFVSLVVSVYVMYNRENFVAQSKKILYSLFSTNFVKRVLTALRFTNKSFMGFFGGKLLDSLIIGVICFFACLLMGLKDAVLISVIIGITNIIPFFGPFIGAIPAGLIVLMDSPWKCLIFGIFIIVLQQFDGNILGPKILGSRTGISGFWVLFSILLGAGLFGPIGMIIGVPLFAVIYAGVKSLVEGSLKKRGLPSETAVYTNISYIDPETLSPVVRHGKKTEASEASAATNAEQEKDKE